MAVRVKVKLERYHDTQVLHVYLPFDVFEAFGTRSRLAVKGELKGFPFRSSIFPMRSEEHTSELTSHRDLHSFPTRRSSDLVYLPFDVFEAFGTRSRLAVKGELKGFPFRSSIFPM